jgi:hypothetical protein
MTNAAGAGAHARSHKRAQVRAARDRSTELRSVTVSITVGRDARRCGIAGFPAPSSGPVLYSLSRAVYGGPSTPSHEAGDSAIAIAEAEAAEDAA